MFSMSSSIILFIGGFLIGVVLTYYFLKERARGWFESWKVESEGRIREDVIKRSRAALKGRVGEQLAPILPMFEYEPSDARFIGSPVDYVIFEGHSRDDITEVIFVDIKTGEFARLTPEQKELKKLVEEGNVRWETIHLGDFE